MVSRFLEGFPTISTRALDHVKFGRSFSVFDMLGVLHRLEFSKQGSTPLFTLGVGITLQHSWHITLYVSHSDFSTTFVSSQRDTAAFSQKSIHLHRNHHFEQWTLFSLFFSPTVEAKKHGLAQPPSAWEDHNLISFVTGRFSFAILGEVDFVILSFGLCMDRAWLRMIDWLIGRGALLWHASFYAASPFLMDRWGLNGWLCIVGFAIQIVGALGMKYEIFLKISNRVSLMIIWSG